MKDKQRILIIIPAYNEQDSIKQVIDDVRRHAPYCDILVINDGSKDNTSLIAKDMSVYVIDLIYNLGIGAAMQTGYLYASMHNYDIAIQFDGDGQHNARYIDNLIQPIINGQADMVIGSRYIKKTSYKSKVSRRIGMIFLSVLIRFLTGQKITDTTSGFRAINKDIIKYFSKNYPADYPEPDVIIRLHYLQKRILEEPVEMRQRQGGSSSITPFKSLFYMIKVSLALIINVLRAKKYC